MKRRRACWMFDWPFVEVSWRKGAIKADGAMYGKEFQSPAGNGEAGGSGGLEFGAAGP